MIALMKVIEALLCNILNPCSVYCIISHMYILMIRSEYTKRNGNYGIPIPTNHELRKLLFKFYSSGLLPFEV